jgi:hypothetical protein
MVKMKTTEENKGKLWDESNQVHSNCEGCNYDGWIIMTDGTTPELCRKCFTK